jgi:hypothetical protein
MPANLGRHEMYGMNSSYYHYLNFMYHYFEVTLYSLRKG